MLIMRLDQLPSLEGLREKARRSREPIDFNYEFSLKEHTGFLPVQVHGRNTGFEYYFEPIPDGTLPSEAEQFGSHQIVVRTGGNIEEGRASLVFLKVLAQMTGGAYVYPDDNIVIPPEESVRHIQELIAACEPYFS